MSLYDAAESFVSWLESRVVAAARGEPNQELDVDPSGKFWLGRLAPQETVIRRGLGDRGERLEPCAVGLRLKPAGSPPYKFRINVSACIWERDQDRVWRKSAPIQIDLNATVHSGIGITTFGESEFDNAFQQLGTSDQRSANVQVEVAQTPDGHDELTIQVVNTSTDSTQTGHDCNLYQAELTVSGIDADPYLLESLPDSFRYDRRVTAYGINCGVAYPDARTFQTTDAESADRYRPEYWGTSAHIPALRFTDLSADPITTCQQLLDVLKEWGDENWSEASIAARAESEGWTSTMQDEAVAASRDFWSEFDRLSTGVQLLKDDQSIHRSFQLMNRAMQVAAGDRYDRWRPFQIGFLLSTLASIADPTNDWETAEIVWFATGGGKTETYLGLLVTAAFYDRLTGKRSGLTAWSRFPLRMLSLQQTQRFADAIAAAELVRREEDITGAPLSLGFFVGGQATPNSIKADPSQGEPDPDDPAMPERYRVLMTCPFCHGASLDMHFNRRDWKLEHRCSNTECPWPEPALPFFIVDDEIYRFLPTILVGTLDKAAGIGFQASMRGLIGPPWGCCSIAGHGYVYAPRSKRPNGCLVPDCGGHVEALDMDSDRFGPSFRLQDELHLLKDSLGAVDAHYESLLDHLQHTLCGSKPKILASSATLSGYESQVDILYKRKARAFPIQGPSASAGFWTQDSKQLMRRYVAVAPRGVTLEYAIDRLLTEHQHAIRELLNSPQDVCADAGIDPQYVGQLLALYGTNVVYGNTIRDLDAVQRSVETQVQVDGTVNTASLTGRTDFDEVRTTLSRLHNPEDDFNDRIHIITASSMMSHGVDIDRLNIMAMLGLPLTTAEFMQSTARVGRAYPGLVWVTHKIGRERDASVYRSFRQFIYQGDRFVEPVPVTRRSRKVLERTLPGLELARIRSFHEHEAQSALTTVRKLREYARQSGLGADSEYEALVSALELDDALDEGLRTDLRAWLDAFYRNLTDPAGTYRFPDDLSPGGGPMRSLRDVEEQVPVHGSLVR